jgi:hypothetical protein
MNPKFLEELLALRREVEGRNNALNGDVYPPDSQHAQGVPSPTCQFCIALVTIDCILGKREKPYLTQKEMADNARRTGQYEREFPQEARVNNLYRFVE